MKDITLKIIGRQLFKDREEEQMEFVTDGRLYFRNGAAYVVYEESGVSGMPSGKTVLKVKDDTVRMRRAGGVKLTRSCILKEVSASAAPTIRRMVQWVWKFLPTWLKTGLTRKQAAAKSA